MASTCLIGIDVGTTSLKAVLIDGEGNRLADYGQAYDLSRPSPGAAEQNPEDWFQAVLATLDHFEKSFDLSGLRGVGICSQVNTHVFVGEDGLPVRPAITWQDSRSAPDAARIDRQVTDAQKTAWFGGPMAIDASNALSRMAFVNRIEPENYAATRHVLLPKDYCVMRLTGALASDPIAAVGMVNSDGYVGALLDLVPRAKDLLPPLQPFDHVSGTIGSDFPCAGAPVVVGAMDAWGGMFGIGVVKDGQAMYQSGTSEIPGIVSSRIVPTPGVVLFPPYQGIIMHAAPTQSGGAALKWVSTLLGRTPEELSDLAAQCGPSDAVPLFLPHFDGERAPIWDASSRAVFARMDARAGAPELVRSVMEGVAFAVRWSFDALQKSAGRSVNQINLGGGGSKSDIWCQIRADALQIPLRRVAVPDACALGAAILAGVGSKTFSSLQQAAEELVTFDKSFEPDPALKSYYDDKFAKYRELYEELKPFNAGFA